ncbi:glycine--tRNA ligase subunit beta [Wenzhouxiangella marina]|uniref:Glycine--tRNA ligase beta subunit n=1 Tax=Wenzhouxiangella marina TaxID=1579979 RepID=A0A0K0XS01_9GAMM|nr:glycine--tRNA ligase subunit beta [Wenzhouxiangella marina]AKS40397.1 Glycine--tRNA ligase beta subunit [Wenzhouxiangella marina]MBB6088281.1 glycyl-tRNA synthetase beta chain [Wenzhouxiangella marina]
MSTRADLLIELGCEELPARSIDQQLDLLCDGLQRRLVDAGLMDEGAAIARLATPRRLAVRFSQVLDRQADRELERKGPAENVALDADGKPSKAAEGFARSLGKSFEELDWLETDQGRWLYARITEPGKALDELLGPMLEETVKAMAGARSMRWSDLDERFLRPVRWLCVLHGERAIPLSLFGLSAGRRTQGHRIHGPGWHELASASDYERVLEAAHVVADRDRRRERIASQVSTLADKAGMRVDDNPDLLDENVGLTEWPVAVMGSFDEAFLEVPEEALISSMQQHQKCFPVRNVDGSLAPRFIAIANIESKDETAMIAGFERVIRPRLSDARFFWDQDRKQRLADRASRLDDVLFQEKLGSTGDKAARLGQLGRRLAESLAADPEQVARAASLCKCDLLTEMVGEFPELQGIMGRYYALADGENDAVAMAIEEHYMPRQAGAELPGTPAGQALALADRLDTVVGIFAAGKKPKGGKDPFALRRAALGIVRILEDSNCGLSLAEAVDLAAEALGEQLEVDGDLKAEVERFIFDRLRSHAAEAGIETATIQAVEAGKAGSVADFMARARAIQAFADDERAESLIAANKRTSNLLKQAENERIGDVDAILLQDDAEKRLFADIQAVETDLESALARADYPAALAELAGLREGVDAFFDQVMVMAEDARLRANRLALLTRLRGLIIDIADLARLGR